MLCFSVDSQADELEKVPKTSDDSTPLEDPTIPSHPLAIEF